MNSIVLMGFLNFPKYIYVHDIRDLIGKFVFELDIISFQSGNLINVDIYILYVSETVEVDRISDKNDEFHTDEKITDDNVENSDTLFDAFIKFLMKIGHKPSVATGIIYKDELVWSKGYGYYDIENQKQATTDTLYLQASVSKTITAQLDSSV